MNQNNSSTHILYSYWRSSASWRVRWALELKKIAYQIKAINLLKAEHKHDDYLAVNPAGLVPLLQLSSGERIAQSMAILTFLESQYPSSYKLFSSDAFQNAKIIELCETINADTAPLQSPNVQSRHSADETEKNRWAQDFIKRGLTTYQKLINPNTDFSLGDIITAADLFLIPQIYNAKRYGINVADEFPSLNKIYEKALNTPECIKASPENQIDSLKV